ncbi:hypothetical protein TNCT_215841 [Trichonephila clavata]|uniref:Uncharacterized protein n=1 Tax=Trichonephila clavata TaxID=2740835 RepID=A0A8X6FXR9_TRICU|nr:hypothetical protein TNCT_215841 [Trichonephila clavata]
MEALCQRNAQGSIDAVGIEPSRSNRSMNRDFVAKFKYHCSGLVDSGVRVPVLMLGVEVSYYKAAVSIAEKLLKVLRLNF